MKKQIIDTDAVATPGPMTKNPYQNSTPMRGLETHVEGSMGMNHMEASRVHGAGIAFGKVGNKPDHSNAVPRGSIGTRMGTTSRNL